MVVAVAVDVAEEGEGLEGMAMSQLNMTMEAMTAVRVTLGVGAVGEDVVSEAVEEEGTMVPSLMLSKMEDTMKKHLLKVAVVVAVGGEDIVEGDVAIGQMGRSRQLLEERYERRWNIIQKMASV